MSNAVYLHMRNEVFHWVLSKPFLPSQFFLTCLLFFPVGWNTVGEVVGSHRDVSRITAISSWSFCTEFTICSQKTLQVRYWQLYLPLKTVLFFIIWTFFSYYAFLQFLPLSSMGRHYFLYDSGSAGCLWDWEVTAGTATTTTAETGK